MTELQQRYAVELVPGHAACHDLEHAGHDSKVGTPFAARIHQRQDLVLAHVGGCDKDKVDVASADYLAKFICLAEDVDATECVAWFQVIRNYTDDLVPV